MPRPTDRTDRDRWTAAFGAGFHVKPSRSKYGAVPAWIEGIRFASLREARRYRDLQVLQQAGAIERLELQPRYELAVTTPSGARLPCGVYTADFRYVDVNNGEVITEDVKSAPTRTTAYRLRKRLAEAIYGITIREV